MSDTPTSTPRETPEAVLPPQSPRQLPVTLKTNLAVDGENWGKLQPAQLLFRTIAASASDGMRTGVGKENLTHKK